MNFILTLLLGVLFLQILSFIVYGIYGKKLLNPKENCKPEPIAWTIQIIEHFFFAYLIIFLGSILPLVFDFTIAIFLLLIFIILGLVTGFLMNNPKEQRDKNKNQLLLNLVFYFLGCIILYLLVFLKQMLA